MPRGRPSKKNGTQEKNNIVVETPRLYCLRCGEHNIDKFYKVKDPARKFLSRVCYCKKCVKEIYDGYRRKYRNNIYLALYYMCRKVDLPYIHIAAQTTIENIDNPNSKIQGEEAVVSAYMKNIAFSDNNGWGSTFDESEGIQFIPDIDAYDEVIRIRKKKREDNKKINSDKYEYISYDAEELIDKWGQYDSNDLAYLESEYLDWEDKLNGINEKSMEIMVIEVCRQCLDIRKDREGGINVDKKVKTLQDLLKSSGLIEAQTRISEQKSVGMKIDDIEFHRPIVEADPDLDDVDKYLPRTIGYIASLSNVWQKKNIYTEKYEEYYGKYSIDIIDELRRNQLEEKPTQLSLDEVKSDE